MTSYCICSLNKWALQQVLFLFCQMVNGYEMLFPKRYTTLHTHSFFLGFNTIRSELNEKWNYSVCLPCRMLAGHMSILVTTTNTGTLRASARPRCSLVMPTMPALLPTWMRDKRDQRWRGGKRWGHKARAHIRSFSMPPPPSPWACRSRAGVPSCRRQWSWGTSRGQPGRWRWWPLRISHRSWSSQGRRRGCPACSPPKGAELH